MPERKLKQFKEYVETKLGRVIDSSALEESCGSMKVLCIKNIDVYDSIAKSFGVKELITQRNIYYSVNLPDDSDWKIILSHNNRTQFENKYGSQYKLIKPKYNLQDDNYRTHASRLV
ncbi:MAG: hypothetical protein ACP5N1_04690 [Candidatus Woesearchaeota archaeon]